MRKEWIHASCWWREFCLEEEGEEEDEEEDEEEEEEEEEVDGEEVRGRCRAKAVWGDRRHPREPFVT